MRRRAEDGRFFLPSIHPGGSDRNMTYHEKRDTTTLIYQLPSYKYPS